MAAGSVHFLRFMSFENGVSNRQKTLLDSIAQLFSRLEGIRSGRVVVIRHQINEKNAGKDGTQRQISNPAIHFETGTGSKFHISRAYSVITRSDENLPQRAMLRMAMEAQ